MRPSEAPTSGRARFSPGGLALYAIVALAVWLAWEVVKVPVLERAPPALAIRISPGSPEVLRRASEAEFVDKRTDNALVLAQESLSRAPFNARALRVAGLALADQGETARANEILTLAGNWSLRDDPAHAWLVEYRLRQGDYYSAFAHADTLVRRRPDLYPSVFSLFTTAVSNDARAVPVLSGLIAANPPWRGAYINHLYELEGGAPIIFALASSLERTRNPLTMQELQHLYAIWISERRFPAVRMLREHLDRPPINEWLQNGDFSVAVERQFYPFGWLTGAAAGMSVSVVEDDLRANNLSLRLEYDGFGTGAFAEQVLLLPPGAYVLEGEERADTSAADTRMDWYIVCADNNAKIGRYRPQVSSAWQRFDVQFVVPSANCSVQRLLLLTDAGDRRTNVVAWFDNFAIRPAR